MGVELLRKERIGIFNSMQSYLISDMGVHETKNDHQALLLLVGMRSCQDAFDFRRA